MQYNICASPSLIMHIDLNCCFAIIEQQANRLLRGRAVAVSAYGTPRGMVIAASYEAKRQGIKLGVNNREAKAIDPKVVILPPDPAKYREAHRLFKEVLLRYTDDVHPKSIDEFVLNFKGAPAIRNSKTKPSPLPGCALQGDLASPVAFGCPSTATAPSEGEGSVLEHDLLAAASSIPNPQSLVQSHDEVKEVMLRVGQNIKRDIKEALGEWVTVNIGIGPNRFLAKYAAGFGKPDGMTLIDYNNLRQMYDGMDLVDLPGINRRYKTRLQLAGIRTPLQFLDAPLHLLQKIVFKSIVGYYWYQRLRGYEIDDYETSRKSIGHQYALSKRTMDREVLARSLLKLCEKTGRRLRKNDLTAHGIHLYVGLERPEENVEHIGFEQMQYLSSWHRGVKLSYPLYATQDIYLAAKHLLDIAEIPSNVRIIAVTVFALEPSNPEQMSLFAQQIGDRRLEIGDSSFRSFDEVKRISDAVDEINNRYGEFVVTSASMMDMSGEILDRVAFGQIKDM